MFFEVLDFFFSMKYTNGFTDQMMFWFYFITNVLCTLKFCVFINRASDVWNILNIANIHFFKSQQCRENKRKLNECKTKILKISKYVFYLYFTVIILWVIAPLVANAKKKLNQNQNGFYKNILNLWYPVTINTFNQYFYFFYITEFVVVICLRYSIFIDNFILCFSLFINTQYKILTQAFSNIGQQDKSNTDNTTNGRIIS